jgi:hypothetical protein
MGKMLIILVAGLTVVASLSRLQLSQSSSNASENASEDFEGTQARNLAMSGIDLAIARIAADSNWLTGYRNNSASSGTLNVAVEKTTAMYPGGPNANLKSARLITSVGTVMGESRIVQAIVQIPSLNSLPAGLKYALYSQGDLELIGGQTIRDDNNPAWNANIHTNAALKLSGTNTVTGYGEYFSYINSNPAANLLPTFNPNVPTGGAVEYKTPMVPTPTIDPTKWASLATKKYNGSTTFSGNTVLGSKSNPEIIYVNGNLTLSGNVSGYGVLLVTGNVFLVGNTTVTGMDPSGNNLGIICGGDAQVTGNVTVSGNFLTKGDFLSDGPVTIVGSVAANGRIGVSVKGGLTLRYRPPMAGVMGRVWGSMPGRPQVLSMYE